MWIKVMIMITVMIIVMTTATAAVTTMVRCRDGSMQPRGARHSTIPCATHRATPGMTAGKAGQEKARRWTVVLKMRS